MKTSTHFIVPYQVGPRVVFVEVIVKQGPVGLTLDALPSVSQHYRPVVLLQAEINNHSDHVKANP